MRKSIIIYLVALFLFIPTFHVHATSSDNNQEILFTDLSKAYWAYDEIVSYVKRVGVENVSEESFHPGKPLTREEFIGMLMAFHPAKTKTVGVPFQDITREDSNYSVIEQAISEGIIIPEEQGIHFYPEQLITREEAGVMIARSLKLEENKDSMTYKDKDLIKQKGLIMSLKQHGIMIGHNDGSFGPSEPITKAQAVVTIERALRKSQKDHSLSVKEIKDIIINNEQKTIKSLLAGKINDRNRLYTFEEISPELDSFYSEEMQNHIWKKVYQQSFGWLYEPASLIPFTMARLDFSVNVLEQSNEKISISFKTAADEAGYVTPSYITYQLAKQKDNWVIAGVKKEDLTTAFTTDEAKKIVVEQFFDNSLPDNTQLRLIKEQSGIYFFGVFKDSALIEAYQINKEDGFTMREIK